MTEKPGNLRAKSKEAGKNMTDPRTTFDELRALYTEWSDRHNTYQFSSARLVRGLANGFRHYIGAPETFQDFDKSTKRYVFALVATRDDEGKIHFNEPKYMTDVLTLDEDGYWLAGIGVVLDRGEHTYPKTDFRFYIRFVLRGRQCELQIGDESAGKIEFDIENEESVKPVYEYMVRLLKETLAMKPWSIPSKAPIGFEVPPRPQEPIEQ
jgi:hypothetical protein